MKKLRLAVSLLIAGCAGNPPVVSDGMLVNAAIPLDPLLQCASNALRIYELPPRIAITLACEREIDELEAWTAEFVERTGLTLEEVEYIISEASAN
jgi:hypothetical protein